MTNDFSDKVADFLDDAGISYQRNVTISRNSQGGATVTSAATAQLVRVHVPSEDDFGGRPFTEADDLEALADHLIETTGELDRLQSVRLTYRWKAKAGRAKGQPRTGSTELVTGQSLAFIDDDDAPEVMIWLGADTAREDEWSSRQIEAALFGQLSAITFDEKDAMKIGGPDVVGYRAAIRRYGAWSEMLKAAASAFEQAPLFGED